MLGAIVGDIVGSRFEWHNRKSKDFEFLERYCCFTDDTVMSLAVADAILRWRDTGETSFAALGAYAVHSMQEFGRKYPDAGYGGSFARWLGSGNPRPYNSWGNGSAMRVSACGWAGRTLEEVKEMSRAVTAVTHDHPEGIKGAEATAVATYLARIGKSKEEIREVVVRDYYPLDFTLDEIRPGYAFDVSCQGSVPQALEAFFESTSFEDAIRNAISIGGDSDTIGAICGAVAGAFYGIPAEIRAGAITFLSQHLLGTLRSFEGVYRPKEPKVTACGPSVERFVEAQKKYSGYESALEEVRDGAKRGHWIWYVFPQVRGLGHSFFSEFYGITCLEEAKAYWEHPILGARLREITDAFLGHAGRKTAEEIFGNLDAMKVRSCMTLFSLVGDGRFAKALDLFYEGREDRQTLKILGLAK